MTGSKNFVSYRFAFCMLLLFFPASCNQQKEPESKSNGAEKRLEVKAFEMHNGWGYDILIDGKVFIHQDRIPAVSGIRGFKSEADALEVGTFVARKIVNNKPPIAVKIKDLDSMKIAYE